MSSWFRPTTRRARALDGSALHLDGVGPPLRPRRQVLDPLIALVVGAVASLAYVPTESLGLILVNYAGYSALSWVAVAASALAGLLALLLRTTGAPLTRGRPRATSSLPAAGHAPRGRAHGRRHHPRARRPLRGPLRKTRCAVGGIPDEAWIGACPRS